jgi:hypothetical protein
LLKDDPDDESGGMSRFFHTILQGTILSSAKTNTPGGAIITHPVHHSIAPKKGG